MDMQPTTAQPSAGVTILSRITQAACKVFVGARSLQASDRQLDARL